MSNLTMTFDGREDRAKARGLQVVDPLPNEVFIDIDNLADLAFYEKILPLVQQHISLVEVARWPSASLAEDHFHIFLRCAVPLQPAERIALQAALGSDRKRELWSVLRLILSANVNATCFFETPEREANIQALRTKTELPQPSTKEELVPA